MDLHAVAEEAAEIARAKLFSPTTWENLTTKMFFVVTELDEAVQAVEAAHSAAYVCLDTGRVLSRSYDDGATLAEELADAAIRILVSLDDLCGREWCSRVEYRQPLPRSWEPLERVVWPVISRLAVLGRHWRDDDHRGAAQALELALLETFRAADRIGFDLYPHILRKQAVNRSREPLHGHVRRDA
jgi:hypothetical protein